MVKLSNHSWNLHFSFLVTPSFTKRMALLLSEFTRMRVEKMHYFAIIIQKFLWEDPQTPSSFNYINFSHVHPKDFLGIKSAKQ